MYRVLAARSLKFLEQREEESFTYQRERVKLGRTTGNVIKTSKAAASSSSSSEEKESFLGDGDDFFAHNRPQYHNEKGGTFNVTHLEKPKSSNAVYARQSGEKAAQNPPLLGYPPKPDGTSPSNNNSSTTTANVYSALPGEPQKAHAQIIVHEKKDKSDQLNLRIKNHMEKQKLQTYILVDEAIQKRLVKNHTKKLNVSASLAKLRGVKNQIAPSSVTGEDDLGKGVWSMLGHDYKLQGDTDLELPALNVGVPLKDLTKSKQPRPTPLKEASDHRKKYESLVELFRQQRHRVMSSPMRDGQDGVPRPQSARTVEKMNQAANQASAASSWDVAASLMDTNISDENGSNRANQSLLARLYQTQMHNKVVEKNNTNGEVEGKQKEDESGNPTKRMAHSASAGGLNTSSSGNKRALDGPMTSVERIAALQPRKLGWDSMSVRQLASSASVPNFERRGIAASNMAASSAGLGHVQKAIGLGLNINVLPDSHPAHTHVGLNPNQTQPGEKLNSISNDPKLPAHMLPMNGTKRVSAPVPSVIDPVADREAALREKERLRKERQQQLTKPNSMLLSADHPDYLNRKAELLQMVQARSLKKKQKEEKEKALFEAVTKQLEESRLDHLHRWRNAFDGTKQRMDRLLIKRLVSRAEARAAALEGGYQTLGPVIDQVLTEQELSEVTADPAGHAREMLRSRSKSARELGRDMLEEDDFNQQLGYEEFDDPALSSSGAQGSQSLHDNPSLEYQQQVMKDLSTLPDHFHTTLPSYHTKNKNKSGMQMSHVVADTLAEKHQAQHQAEVDEALLQMSHGSPAAAAQIESRFHHK